MEYRKRVEKLLLSSGREGMEKLLEWWRKTAIMMSRTVTAKALRWTEAWQRRACMFWESWMDMAYLLLLDNEDTLEAKRNSLAVCALLHRIGILGTGLEETKEGEVEKKAVDIVSSFITLDKEEERALLCNEVVGRDFCGQ